MDTRTLVGETVICFLKAGKSFTALDVTLEVNKKEYIRHGECREIVRTFMEDVFNDSDGQYADFHYFDTLIPVQLKNGSTVKAQLYHPVNVSPDNYTGRNKSIEDILLKPKDDPYVPPEPVEPVMATKPEPKKTIEPVITPVSNPTGSSFVQSILDRINNDKKKYSA